MIVIGGGPKAVALAVKNNVFQSIHPESGVNLHIIEKQEIGHHWTGGGGFTNGRQLLGTPAEKDLGFPYEKAPYQNGVYPTIRRKMMDYSWTNYLQDQGLYGLWVDQGRKPPHHKGWAHYLKWAFDRVQNTTTFHQGEAIQITKIASQWSVEYKSPEGKTRTVFGDDLVLTGPGKLHHTFAVQNHPRLLSFQSYWPLEKELQTGQPLKIALIGGGENAASVALSLLSDQKFSGSIDIILPKGFIYSRGESVFENHFFTAPDKNGWEGLAADHRRHFMARTDLGVFSQNALESLTLNHGDIRMVPGTVVDVIEQSQTKLSVSYAYNGHHNVHAYDYVICCHALSPMWFLDDLLEDETRSFLKSHLACDITCKTSLAPLIDDDLSIKNLMPKLYLPMLAGFAQGPGFANLSCLGRLSDRILEKYFIEP